MVMSKKTRQLSGASQKKYFRDLFRSEEGITAEAADRLVAFCTDEIAHIRVRLPLAVRRPLTVAGVAVAAAVAKAPAETSVTAEVGVAAVAAVDEPEFDPHAFSLIVMLRKAGKSGLAAKLTELGDIDRLKAIAKAQHVSLDAVDGDLAAIVMAIVEGTERRLAHRQAAAS